MKTLKQTVVILDEGDEIEIRAGDITVNTHMGRGGGGSSVRVSRPPTDGRFLAITWGVLDEEGNPQTRDDDANGYIDVAAKNI